MKMFVNPRLSISFRVSLIVLLVACLTSISTSVLAGVRITLCSSSKSFAHTTTSRRYNTLDSYLAEYTGWRRKNVLNIRMRCEQSY